MRLEEFAEQEDLLRELLRLVIVRKEIQQFVAEDGGATGLEHHDWSSCSDLLFQNCQGRFEQMLRTIEHAEIVEWSPAADLCLRQPHLESSSFQKLNRSDRRFRMEIVVERIRP